MAKRSEEQKEQSRVNLRHPVRWLRGDNLPPEQVRPWELAAHIVPGIFGGLSSVFTKYLTWLWQNVFHIDKGPQAVYTTVSAVWDGLNDPLIGAYMDYKNFPSRINRRFMRIAVVTESLLTLITVFDMGLSVWQRVALIIVTKCIKDFFGTAGAVAGTKVYAQITPYSSQRGKLVTASRLGEMIKSNLGALFWPIIGLRDILGFSPYKMFALGSVIFSIPAMIGDMAPSFVLQRVPDPPQGEKAKTFKETLLEIKESFAIMRHNKFFLLNTAAKAFTVFTPGVSDEDFYRFGGINDTVERTINAWQGKGNAELLMAIRNAVTGTPGSLLQPFAASAVKKIGGPRNMMLAFSSVNIVFYFLRYFLGVKTISGILFMWFADMVINIFRRWDQVANGIVDFEMFDYVEWKTGRRSEGVKIAVDGLINKVALNNVDTIVGSLALKKIGFDITLDTNQPASYVKWATRFYFLSPVADYLAYFIARLLYKYPAEMRHQVEAELVERRKLTEEMAAEMPV